MSVPPPIAPGAGTVISEASRRVAFFSMEVGVDERLPIYSGGLGVLAGDTLRAFADLRIPAVGVTLLYDVGYFRQRLDAAGNQREEPVEWSPEAVLAPLAPRVEVTVAGRPVVLRAWRYDVVGVSGYVVPLLLLDAREPANAPADRALTGRLYGGDERYRLAQEILLGIGGVRMLRALGFTRLERYHLNEGHASLIALELLTEEQARHASLHEALEHVKRQCVFTTHTPVAAGHDRFSWDLVRAVLGEPVPLPELQMLGGGEELNMTRLALNLSHYVNGVAKRHGEISRRLFPGYAIESITNGVHSASWTAPSFQLLFDRLIPGWRRDPFALRNAVRLPPEEVWAAHQAAKVSLIAEVHRRSGRTLAPETFTIGFARRATAYKRADLLFREPERLRQLVAECGPLQLLFAGKAHPADGAGRELIARLVRAAHELGPGIELVYLEDYDLTLARRLTSGVDLWLNTPLRPLEASGTSGMKAAHNGVPSLSVLDGWWLEGHLEGITGWSIGPQPDPDEILEPEAGSARDAANLYAKLEAVIAPLFHRDRPGWIEVMRRTIAFNASFFNAHRMVQQYATSAYMADGEARDETVREVSAEVASAVIA